MVINHNTLEDMRKRSVPQIQLFIILLTIRFIEFVICFTILFSSNLKMGPIIFQARGPLIKHEKKKDVSQ